MNPIIEPNKRFLIFWAMKKGYAIMQMKRANEILIITKHKTIHLSMIAMQWRSY